MALRTMGLTELPRPTLSATYILKMRDRFKVIWIHTCSITTKMIEFKSFGDIAKDQLVSKVMPLYEFSFSVNPANPKLPIPVCCRRDPGPASIVVSNIDFTPKAFFYRKAASVVLDRSIAIFQLARSLTHIMGATKGVGIIRSMAIKNGTKARSSCRIIVHLNLLSGVMRRAVSAVPSPSIIS